MLVKYRPTDWFGLAPVESFARDPFFGPFSLVRQQMERLLGSLEQGVDPTGAVNLEDRGEELVLTAQVPGLAEKDIDLSITGDSVVLRGRRVISVPEGYTATMRERNNFTVQRAYRLPTLIDADRAEAILKNGVLTVTLPKAAEARPRTINVRAS